MLQITPCFRSFSLTQLMENSIEMVENGRLMIIPSTFVGGERYVRQNMYDINLVSSKLCQPDFFITMTCNPNRNEIQSALWMVKSRGLFLYFMSCVTGETKRNDRVYHFGHPFCVAIAHIRAGESRFANCSLSNCVQAYYRGKRGPILYTSS